MDLIHDNTNRTKELRDYISELPVSIHMDHGRISLPMFFHQFSELEYETDLSNEKESCHDCVSPLLQSGLALDNCCETGKGLMTGDCLCTTIEDGDNLEGGLMEVSIMFWY